MFLCGSLIFCIHSDGILVLKALWTQMFCIGEYVYETVVMNHNKSYMKIYREIEQESSLFPFVLFFRVVENDELYNHLL